jgi:hypothetical protein
MNELVQVLSYFHPISLPEMDHVKLLNRIDTKFVFREDQLGNYLKKISAYYSVLTIDGKYLHPYETLYFDTPAFNRYKLRCRKYSNSGISFFEIKSKTNKDRTIKERIQVADIPERLDDHLSQYISEHTTGGLHDFIPSLRVYFDRLTFVNKNGNERLTFDLNLRYNCNCGDKIIENMVIVEVKQDKNTVSPFLELMKLERQPHNYISKYCMGLTCLHKTLKMNNFKQKFTTLNKLGYDIH